MASSVREHAQVEQSEEETVEEGDCPECGGEVAPDGQERVCQDCGLVADVDRIDHGPEWRAFDHSQELERRRVGIPTTVTLHDGGLGSEMGTSAQNDDVGRLRMWHDRVRYNPSSKDSNLKDGLGQIKRIVSSLDLPKAVEERACQHFRDAHAEDAFFGRCIDAGAAACVFVASRECHLGVSLDDVREASQDGPMDTYSMLQRLQRELDVELPPPRPEDSLPRVAGRLEIDDATHAEASEIVDTFVENRSLSGLGPRGIVAMAIYVASDRTGGEQLTQKTIAEAASISQVTLRKRLRDFEEVSE